jgi:hypothetical protein
MNIVLETLGEFEARRNHCPHSPESAGETYGADQLMPFRCILINRWASGERIRNERSSACWAREGRWEGTET